MTKDRPDINAEDVIFNQLEDLLTVASMPCSTNCDSHKGMVNLIRFLSALVKSVFRTNADILKVMKEIKEQQKDLIRMRKVGLWALAIVAAAFLTQFGGGIWAVLKAGLGG